MIMTNLLKKIIFVYIIIIIIFFKLINLIMLCSFRLHFPVFGGSGRVMPHDVVFSGYNVPQGKHFLYYNLNDCILYLTLIKG